MKIHRVNVASRPESKPTAVLVRQCERALVAAARSARISTRKRIHRAAREFIRRHARNRAYLAWVMKRVAANAALAVALLGLGSQAAQAAGAPLFDSFAANPLTGLDAGTFSTIAAGDLDGDGDPDFVASEAFASGQIRYYQNTGTAVSPVLVERVGVANPFTGLVSGWTPILALGDLDSDGDLDLLSGDAYGGPLHYFQNTGTTIAPTFVELVGGANPANNVTGYRSAPALGDVDHDGDLDIVIGSGPGTFRYFRNTGSATLPGFTEQTGSSNPFDGLVAGPGFISTPALGDIDLDGDLDLVSGDEPSGGFHAFENVGSAATARFVAMPERSNPFWNETVGLNSTPTLVDFDADGDLDLVSGERNGGFRSYRNHTGQLVASDEIDPDPIFAPEVIIAFPGADFDGDGDIGLAGTECSFADNIGTATNPQFALQAGLPGLSGCSGPATPIDIDGDSDFDLVASGSLYLNVGTPTAPSFGPAQSLFPTLDTHTNATFGDLDGDGDQDAAVVQSGVNPAVSSYFENVGNATTPSFVEQTGAANLLPAAGPNRRIQLADHDGDGDTDALDVPQELNFVEQTLYWENVSSTTSPHFVARPISSKRNPLSLVLSTGPAGTLVLPPLLADFDGDGDADGMGARLVSPIPLEFDLLFLESSLIRPYPRYFNPIAAPLSSLDAGGFSTIAAADLDGDGDPDFVASDSFASGLIRYYENTGTSLVPFAVERTGAQNPFTGLVSAWTPILAFGDLDSDGDFDVICGQAYYGEPLKYFENTGTPTAPVFVERVGTTNPVGILTGDRTAPALGDVDGDGDLDMVIGGTAGTFRFVRNFGNAEVPAFDEISGPASPFDGLVAGVGFISNPTLGDIDLDGDLDLVSGDETSGGFHYFENTGTATAPVYMSRTGPENPFDGKSVGLNSTPDLIDLDADGDLDLVSGERDGTFEAYYLPEPSKGLLLSAGIVLLGWLRRLRG